MREVSVVNRISESSPLLRRSAIVILVLLVGVVGWLSAAYRSPGSPVAPWWPAAGLAAIAVLASRGNRVMTTVAIAVASFAANALLGREMGLIAGYAMGNALEAYLVALVIARPGSEARLASVRDVTRFIVAAAVGATAVGIVGGATATLVTRADFMGTLFSIVASHASAILIIVPIALVRRRSTNRRHAGEVVVQFTTLVVLVAVSFWPGVQLPLAFLPLVAILWSAFRLPMTLIAVELLVLAVLAATLTSLEGGSIGAYVATEPRAAAVLLQLFLVVHALVALLVSAARNDWASVVTGLEARDALLRGGIVSSDTGILIAELAGERLLLASVNPAALRALGQEESSPHWMGPGQRVDSIQPILGVPDLDALIRARESGRVELERAGRRYDVEVRVHRGTGATTMLTVVFTDVTARDERERSALEAVDRLQDLNRQKDDFIAAVSHELRTPVTSILGFAEDLADADLDAADRRAVQVVERNARRLADVIEDVLEISSAGDAERSLRPSTEVDLVELARLCASEAMGLANSRNVQVVVSVPHDLPPLRSVPQDITRAVMNLLSNAVKFTPDGGLVKLQLDRVSDGVAIAISDRGPGIPPPMLERVWERFARVPDAPHRDVSGTGLGLPIVRALVEQKLGGRVSLQSDGHSGTTAVIVLPLDRDAVLSDPSTEL